MITEPECLELGANQDYGVSIVVIEPEFPSIEAQLHAMSEEEYEVCTQDWEECPSCERALAPEYEGNCPYCD